MSIGVRSNVHRVILCEQAKKTRVAGIDLI